MLNLPKEILNEIFEELDSNDLKNMPVICKKFSKINYEPLWMKISKCWFYSNFYNCEKLEIPKTKNYFEWQSMVQLAWNIAGGAPCISWGDNYANDLVVNCFHIFYEHILGENDNFSFTNIRKQLHFINPEILVKITPIMYELYPENQEKNTSVNIIKNRYNRYYIIRKNDFGGYYYAWGDVIKKF